MTEWLKRNLSTILTCVGIGGFIFAGVDAAKKAKHVNVDTTGLSVVDKAKAVVPHYVRPIAVGIASAGCVLAGNGIDRHEISKLSMMLTSTEAVMATYMGHVKDIFGESGYKYVSKSMDREFESLEKDHPGWKETQTYEIEIRGQRIRFESTDKDVLVGLKDFTDLFGREGVVTEEDLAQFLGITKLVPPLGEDEVALGWDRYSDEVWYGSFWLEYNIVDMKDENGYLLRDDKGRVIQEIQFPVEAHCLTDPVWDS